MRSAPALAAAQSTTPTPGATGLATAGGSVPATTAGIAATRAAPCSAIASFTVVSPRNATDPCLWPVALQGADQGDARHKRPHSGTPSPGARHASPFATTVPGPRVSDPSGIAGA